MENFEIIWQELQIQMDQYESNFDEITKQKYGIYWTNLDLAYEIVSNLFDNISQDFIDNIDRKKILEPCVGMGSFIFSFLRKLHEKKISKEKINYVIKNIYFCDIDSDILNSFFLCYKNFIKNLFNIEIHNDLLKTNSSMGLIFDKSSKDYISIEKALSKDIKFDLIITNPPYKGLKINAKNYSDKIEYDSDKIFYNELSKRLDKNFKLSNQGVPNLYKLFVEKIILEYTNEDAYISLLIPNTFLADKTTFNLRSYIIENTEIKRIDCFEEKPGVFKGVTQALANILLFKRKNEEYSILFSSGSKENIVKIEDVKSFDDNLSLTNYEEKDINTLREIKKFPTIGSLSFIKNKRGELDLTAFKKYIKKNKTELKLIKGVNIQKFFLKEIDSGFYVSDEFISKSKKSIFINKKRIACPQISNQKSDIRIKFSLINENQVLGNSCNFIFVEENPLGYNIYYLLALLNTDVINWFFKKFNSNNHIGNYEISKFPVHSDRKIIENISLLCKEYLKSQDGKILDCINNITLKGFNLLGGIDNHFNESKNDFIFGELDEKKFFKKKISQDLSAFENYSLLAKKYKNILIEKNILINNIGFKLSDLDLEMISHVPPGGNWKNISETTIKKSQRLMQIAKNGGRTTLYGRIDYKKPSYTITTYFNRPGNGTYVHPKLERVITAREAARLQSFPDNYYFYGNKKDILTQIGNAVPCLLAQAIGTRIKEILPTIKTFGDLFAGAGGMSQGMFQAGLKPIFANDFSLSACITYKANHFETDVIHGDISASNTKNKIFKYSHEIDILCGGPPCQGFSNAGKRIIDDPRNKLFLEFIDSISMINPKVVVMENVQGFLTLDKGNFYTQTKDFLEGLGYICEGRLLNSVHYGVPQKRKRVVILGVHKKIIGSRNIEEFFPIPTTLDESQQVSTFEAISDLEYATPNEFVIKKESQNRYLEKINM